MARIVPTSGVRWRVAIITELLMMTMATMKMIATASRSTTVARRIQPSARSSGGCSRRTGRSPVESDAMRSSVAGMIR